MSTTARSVGLMTVVAIVVALAGCDTSQPTHSRHRAVAGSEGRPNPDASRPEPTGLNAKGPTSSGWRVDRVIDGDTIAVSHGRRALTVRLIGIDTPETVHPTEPVECYGPQASAFAQRQLWRHGVTLEFDPSQGRHDYYGRTLAYVWDEGRRPTLFNKLAIQRGYALEYTYDQPYRWQSQFLRAETHAENKRRGVWRCPTPGS